MIIPVQGGSFRLPNGNTIITLTHIGKIIEVDDNGNNVWEYTYTTNHIDNYWIARANKYSLDYFQNIILGDINGDEILNVLDIVLMISMILSNEYSVVADVNEDGIVNILDVIIMANILVGGLP
jgi:hypothetical protein